MSTTNQTNPPDLFHTLQVAATSGLDRRSDHAVARLTGMVAKLRGWPCGENRENWYTNLGVWIDELRTALKSGIRPCLHGITNSVGIELVRIPAGTFWMGSPEDEIGRDPLEGPRREVKIDKPFYLGVYTVTQEEYERVTGNNPSYFKQSERHPVECVSWDEAWKFCVALNQLPEELVAGRYYSLPTEAEWEYACRGPGAPSDPFHYGKAITMEEANVLGSCPYRGRRSAELICEEGLRHTVPVQSYVPNGWGLYQMHGNVAEWCFGRVPRCVSSYYKVTRGGYEARYARAAARDFIDGSSRCPRVGFRVMMRTHDSY